MLNIVMPMAGYGSAFKGFKLPKPLVFVAGKPLVVWAINSIRPTREHRFIFIILKEHEEKYGIAERLKHWESNCEVIALPEVTDGAAQTVLKARDFIDCDDPLMISNCDQYVDMDVEEYLDNMENKNADMSLVCVKSTNPSHSYLKFYNDRVVDVVEKQVVSDVATLGIYNYKHGYDFCKYADKMIDNNIRSKGEFYVAPVMGMLLEDGRSLTYKVYDEGYFIGNPKEVEDFERLYTWRDDLSRITEGSSY